ncbi:type VI secretion system contractile sheath small subunit, partial [Salmonella enterica]|nr:type VI secretion system contractile sheath small subunit [Salmonella enterica]
RMKAIAPRVAFAVPNTLTGEGQLMVDITLENMDDFSPAQIARKVDALNQLLEARTQLANLQTYMDGKAGAENLVNKLLQDPTLLKTLANAPKSAATQQDVSADNESAE